MSLTAQVRFYERQRGKFPLPTRRIIHCYNKREAMELKQALEERLRDCGLEMHATKTKIVYCKDSNRKGYNDHIQFDFLGYTFMPRQAQNSRKDGSFTNFLPAVSAKAMKSMREKMRESKTLKIAWRQIEEVAREINPVVRSWINYNKRLNSLRIIM